MFTISPHPDGKGLPVEGLRPLLRQEDAAHRAVAGVCHCTGTGYLRNAGKGGMGRESVGKPAISKGLSAVWAGIGAAAYHLS